MIHSGKKSQLYHLIVGMLALIIGIGILVFGGIISKKISFAGSPVESSAISLMGNYPPVALWLGTFLLLLGIFSILRAMTVKRFD